MGSILFELHNALADSKITYYYQLAAQGKIKKEAYVSGIEYIEYQNSMKASQLASKGIEMGVFPRSAYLPTYGSFEEYYRFQKKAGHSAWIAYTYDQLAPALNTKSLVSVNKFKEIFDAGRKFVKSAGIKAGLIRSQP